jgi:hypothetical protein
MSEDVGLAISGSALGGLAAGWRGALLTLVAIVALVLADRVRRRAT